MKINDKDYNGWFVLAIVAGIIIVAGVAGPLADKITIPILEDGNTNKTASFGSNDDIIGEPLSLDSSFVSVVADSNTLADINTNFNDDTNTISLQVDAEYSDDGTNTTFVLKSKNTAGNVVTLLTFVEVGVLSVPTTDQSVEFTVNIDESVLKGFDNTLEVEDSKISASANRMQDTAGVYFYPITTRAGDSTSPEVKVDGRVDFSTYQWVVTDSKSIDVTAKISTAGVLKMDDISDKITIPIILENADDSPITVELIRNTAI
ncbi:hypothetical protein HNV12_06520 [Methanococcoides sp. SA1]|nr:hypothetical protein [Methanococcoides sp. SA1]